MIIKKEALHKISMQTRLPTMEMFEINIIDINENNAENNNEINLEEKIEIDKVKRVKFSDTNNIYENEKNDSTIVNTKKVSIKKDFINRRINYEEKEDDDIYKSSDQRKKRI